MLVGCAQPRFGDDRIGKCWQNLVDYPGMNLPELGHPVRTRQALPLIFDECEEGQDRGQLARGDDSVGAMETPPERLRTGRTNLGEGTAMEARTSGEPDILFAVEQRIDRIWRHQRRGLFGPFAQCLLRSGREYGRHRSGDRLAEGIGDRGLVQGPERG